MSTTDHDAIIDLLSGLRLEDGRLWGQVAAGFQLEDAALLRTDAALATTTAETKGLSAAEVLMG